MRLAIAFPVLLGARGNLLVATPSFAPRPRHNLDWDLVCRADDSTCAKVEHALPLLDTFVENALRLKPIRIRAVFESFCRSAAGCKPTEVGNCVTSQYISVQEDNQTFLYPQALYRQLPHRKAQLKNHDMLININADHDFYFPRDYPRQQAQRQVSFLDSLAHELVHGLGFMTALGEYLPGLISSYPKNFINRSLSGKQIVSSKEIHFFLSAFDQHIVVASKQTSLSYYANKLKNLVPVSNTTLQSLKSSIHRYPHHAIFSTLTQIVNTPHDIYFFTACGRKVELAADLFALGAAPSHVDYAKYAGSRDHIMRYSQTAGTGIHTLFSKHPAWLTSPFGEDTLAVLATLGYALNPKPRYEDSMAYYYSLEKRR